MGEDVPELGNGRGHSDRALPKPWDGPDVRFLHDVVAHCQRCYLHDGLPLRPHDLGMNVRSLSVEKHTTLHHKSRVKVSSIQCI